LTKTPIDEEEVESLEQENRRLREELARLKRKAKDKNSDAFQE
jgi:IS1 family transposase